MDVTRCGQPRDLPTSIDLSAYRIVQEALTNVVKHARTNSCRVLIGYSQDELILEVTDNGAGLVRDDRNRDARRSLALACAGQGGGLPDPTEPSARGEHRRQRARHHRNARAGQPARRRFSAGPLPGYGFQVSVHIPLPAEARSPA